MSDYIDRIRTAAYRSPSGATFTLQFDDVERSGGKKAAIHELVQQNTASVQDLGNQAERFPMSIYFTGPDCDTNADAIFAALGERGPGALQHPRYGDIPVLPLTWAQTERLVEGLGRIDVRIEFIRVQADVVFPITSTAAGESITATVSESLDTSATTAASKVAPTDAADLAGVKATVNSWLDTADSAFKAITAVNEAIQSEVKKAIEAVRSEIDELIAKPKELFDRISAIAKQVSEVVTDVTAKVKAYKAQIEGYIDQAEAYRDTVDTTVAGLANKYSQAATTVQNLLASFGWATSSTTSGETKSRGDVAIIIDEIEAIEDAVTEAIEAIEDAYPGYTADQETIAALTDAAKTAKSAIMERAYSLKSERRITTASERTPLDLMAELYRDGITDLDTALDEFISTNNLQGDEILLIPAGREVVYYV